MDKPLKPKPDVNIAIFAHILNEFAQYFIKENKNDIQDELHDLGLPLGPKVLELATFREKALKNNNNICQYGRRELKIVNMLHFINNQIFKMLFGKQGDGIEQGFDDELQCVKDDEFRIIDNSPVTNKFVSTGCEEGNGDAANLGPNCASFIAGIIEGILIANNMRCKVGAHFVPEEDDDQKLPEADIYADESNQISSKGSKLKKYTTLYVIKFDREVCERDKQAGQ